MHPNDGRVVSNFIVQALQNQDITVYGQGNQTRSFQYVDDLIEGMIRL
jgi:UDP-glucuronate decarboxylase